MNATAIDTSVLIDAEHDPRPLRDLLPEEHQPYYVPVMAAAEFLAGVHLVKSKMTAEAGRKYYEDHIKPMVDSLGEPEAAKLAWLNAENRRRGQTMKFYDTVIAATVMARGDALLCTDGDYARLKEQIQVVAF